MRKPDQPSNAGNLEEVADWGRLFFGYFILAKQKKVTSCRATPGGFDLGFAFDVGLREKAANSTYVMALYRCADCSIIWIPACAGMTR